MLKHYVEYFYPGILFSETSVDEIKERNPNKINLPENCYGFRFFDRIEIKKDDEILKGEKKNISGIYYDGKVFTLEEVKHKFPNKKNLIQNMEYDDWNKVVKTKTGGFYPFKQEDKIIKKENNG